MGEDILQRQKKLQDYLNRTPFADFIGFKCEIMGDEMTAILPFEEKIIGNVHPCASWRRDRCVS